MLRTLRNSQITFLSALLLLLSSTLTAQEEQQDTVSLISYIKKLENRFSVKFSYLNEDLEGIELSTTDNLNTLEDVLKHIETQFQITIEKISDRYYSLSKNALVNLCGFVLDNFAENTIPGATLEVLGTDTAQITGTDGAFALSNIPRNASLRIRYLGYSTKVIKVEEILKDKGCSKILLAQQYERLNEVIVYEFLTSGIIKEKDASITLNTADFGILPGLIEPDVLQTVQALPGIKSIDETVSDINVRGGTNDQNLILWNGIKMYQSGHFFGLISAFNPYLTDKVTVIKNGTPAAFGDGVSSVIQMETNNQVPDYFSGGAGVNLISGDIFGQIPISENIGLQFSARRSTTDFLNTPTYNNFFDRAFQDSEVTNQNNIAVDEDIERSENFFFYDFTGKLLYDINDDHQFRLNFISITNNLDYQETDVENDETTNSILKQNNFSIGGQLVSRWTNRFSSHLNVYYSNYNLDAQSIFANQIQILNQKNIVDERAIKLDTQYELLENLGWSNGLQYVETGIVNRAFVSQPNFDSNTKGVIRIYAPYSEINFASFKNRFIAKIGARLNYIENLDTFSKVLVEPRLNLNFRLANYLRAEVLGEFKSQTTNQVIDLEQNFLGIEKRRWILSDDNILPITESKQGSVGINYQKNNLYLGLEGFYKKVDGISTRTQGFQNQDQFNGEIGSYDVAGMEFLINKRGDNYSTWFSYTYNKNDYTFESIVPNSFPNNLDIRHTLTFAGTYTYSNLKMSVGVNYRTGRPITEPLAGDEALDTTVFPISINYQTPNSSRLPDYFRADASAVYNFDLSRRVKASAGISLLNITNRKNTLNQYYRINENDQIETVQNISLGLTPNVSFRVSF
ncbi:TonB-dependent receptor plug domain-containing protein [Muricauda sp. JGD-17]|uniref:TonB-dependent receptor plug domain-containing protein n=1 Tax=Flagellimonas ochracea TaxID=2696472 RepID=A0A964TDS4_9FLAO|nr:carboxypeptidase-like regulatory domain-containing protein [Allomuricauda ochracea]NAY92972.1 TonB-dependent receptor plug domain-containing protein [Allomuricauda ochracea]